MGSSFPVTEESTSYPVQFPRRERRRRKKRVHPAVRYGVLLGILALVLVIVQFAVHAVRTDPRDSRAIAERELRLTTLGPGEQVEQMISVFRRPALDYFRASRGLLVLTDRRLIYLAVRPRDLLAQPDAPPTFEERVFPLDTLVDLDRGRTFFMLARAVEVQTPDGVTKLGVPSGAWNSAQRLIRTLDSRHEQLRAEGVRQEKLRERAAAEWEAARNALREPRRYTVRRGDALGSIATQWNTTTERLQRWNRLPDNRIRIGQELIVRPGFEGPID